MTFELSKGLLSFWVERERERFAFEVSAASLYCALRDYVPFDSFEKKKELSVLNVCCGGASDAEAQVQAVLEHMVHESPFVTYTGVDIDGNAIRDARRLSRDQFVNVSYQFIHADARTIELPPQDVVFSIHGESYSYDDKWRKIVSNVARYHKSGGLFVATQFENEEVGHTLEHLKPDYDVLVTERNRHARPHDILPHIVPHKHVIVAKRR